MRFIVLRTLFQHSVNTAVLPIAVLSHVVGDKKIYSQQNPSLFKIKPEIYSFL